MEKTTNITFNLEDGTEAVLEVLEETKINGINYLLVIDAVDDEDEEALILKELKNEEEDTIYVPVEDDKELEALSKVFSELLEDVKFE